MTETSNTNERNDMKIFGHKRRTYLLIFSNFSLFLYALQNQ